MRSGFRFVILPLALSAAIGLTTAPARAATFETAANFNLFVIGNANLQGSDTEGRVAVGGNANLLPYTVNEVGPSAGTNLVVGGNLTTYEGSAHGDVFVGGNASLSRTGAIRNVTANGSVALDRLTVAGNVSAGGGVSMVDTAVNGTITGGAAPVASPVDFSAEAIRLPALSTYLAGYAQTGTISTYDGGAHNYQFTLTGTGAGLNVFNIDGALFSGSDVFNIVLAQPGATALINISGTTGLYYNAGMNVNGGVDGSSVLFNFFEATSLDFYGAGITGSVLAPFADYAPAGYGNINGQVIVNSFSGSYAGGATQVNRHLFAGDLLGLTPQTGGRDAGGSDAVTGDVPEPASWISMIAGFGIVGAGMRRRRGTRTLARA